MDAGQSANKLANDPTVLAGARPAPTWKIWTERGLRWALGVLFLVAGLPKIIHPDLFAESVNNYHLLSTAAVNWLVIVLPWLEVLCALALLAGIAVRGAAALLVLMLCVFTLAIISGLARGLDISCGCFGTGASGKRIGYEEVVRDGVMLVAAAAVFLWNKQCSRASVKRG